MMNSMGKVVLGLALILLLGPVRDGTAGKDGRRVAAARPVAPKRIAEADIIMFISPPNTTTATKRLAVEFRTGRQIIVPGTTDIDGKTFRLGIKGSAEASEGSDKSSNGFGCDQEPGQTFIIVGHHVFDLEEAPGRDPKLAAVNSRWVSRPCIEFTALGALPKNIDEAHSGTLLLVPPLR